MGTGLSDTELEVMQVMVKAAFFLAVILVAAIVSHLATTGVKRVAVKNDHIPNASILINTVRVAVWVAAFVIVLKPVFGIEPTGLWATLGVGSIFISLGLKDTISNIVGGFFLMGGKVIMPGDYAIIGGITGTVVDVTLRHTVVQNRAGDRIVIPNSVLNNSAVTRLPVSSESMGTIEFTMESGYDPDKVAEDLVAIAKEAAAGLLRDDMPPKVIFDSVTPYGVKGLLYFYACEGVLYSVPRNAIVRSMAKRNYFTQSGARAIKGPRRMDPDYRESLLEPIEDPVEVEPYKPSDI